MTRLILLSLVVSATAQAAPLDACQKLYADVVTDGQVDYERVASHPNRPACTRALAQATPPPTGTPAAVAFWADAYNLLSLLAIAEDPARWSPQQDGKVLFRDRRFLVAGEQLTLDEIERDRLGRSTRDPRVEFLLSCGSRSCALLPQRLLSSREDASLASSMEDGMRRWFARPENLRVRRDRGVVEIGQLLQQDWHGGDFERAGTPVVELVAQALETRPDPGDRDAARDLRAGKLKLAIRPYDWRVNRLRRVFLLP